MQIEGKSYNNSILFYSNLVLYTYMIYLCSLALFGQFISLNGHMQSNNIYIALALVMYNKLSPALLKSSMLIHTCQMRKKLTRSKKDPLHPMPVF